MKNRRRSNSSASKPDRFKGPIQRTTLVDQVISVIRHNIASGEYQPDSQLPGEIDLARSLGVSRSTIRAAIKVLNHLGVLETQNGRGTFLTHRQLQNAGAPSLADIQKMIDALELRYAIESQAARFAATRRSSAQLAKVKRIWDAFCRAATAGNKSTEECIRLDLEFHRAIVHAAHNAFLEKAHESVNVFTERAIRIMLNMGPLEKTRDVHKRLINAIETKNESEALRAVRENFDEINSRIQILLEKQVPTQ